MKLSTAQDQKMLTLPIETFYGINRRDFARTGEMEDMINMSADRYPCASPRQSRGTRRSAPGTIAAAAAPITAEDGEVTTFTGVAGGAFYYNGVKKSGSVELSDDYAWEIARLGSLYVINGCGGTKSAMYRYNAATDDFAAAGTLMDDLIVTAGTNETGTYLATIRYGYEAVEDYTATDGMGTSIDNMDFFDKYAANGVLGEDNIFEKNFSVGDEVTIEGFPSKSENFGQVWSYQSGTVYPQSKDYSDNNTVDTDIYADLSEVDDRAICRATVKAFGTKKYTIDGVDTYAHYIYFELTDKNGDSINFDTMEGSVPYYCTGVTISTRRRVFSHICVYHNRVWGTSPLGSVIYASTSDDIFSFSSEDIYNQYAVRLPSDTPGAFVALVPWGGDLLAFKSDSISVIAGTGPSNYYMYAVRGRGAIDGKSVVAIPEGVFFLSKRGFCMYSGNTPTLIGQTLDVTYTAAVAGYDGIRCYAAATKADGSREMAVYDTRYGLWHIEDDGSAQGFFVYDGDLYLVTATAFRKMTGESEAVSWSMTTARGICDTLDHKAINDVWIFARLEKGTAFTVETSINDEDFVTHSEFSETGTHIFRCPVRAINAESFRLRLSGTGAAVIHRIDIRYTQGGRNY